MLKFVSLATLAFAVACSSKNGSELPPAGSDQTNAAPAAPAPMAAPAPAMNTAAPAAPSVSSPASTPEGHPEPAPPAAAANIDPGAGAPGAADAENADTGSSSAGSIAGLPPVEGRLVGAPAPTTLPDGSVEICKSGPDWVSLIAKNNMGCAKACEGQGMNCRRSYHDEAGVCGPQPFELGCGQLAEHGSDFCACSSETFFQGKLHYEHPRTRVTPPLETCQAGEGWATLVFHDGSGCSAACETVGLKCHTAFQDLELECGPQADPAFKLDCGPTGNKSDFCVCTSDGSAVAGLPGIVVNAWRPF